MDGDFLTRISPSPDGYLHIPLQNHVGIDNCRKAYGVSAYGTNKCEKKKGESLHIIKGEFGFIKRVSSPNNPRNH
jgi:hypothetical protein